MQLAMLTFLSTTPRLEAATPAPTQASAHAAVLVPEQPGIGKCTDGKVSPSTECNCEAAARTLELFRFETATGYNRVLKTHKTPKCYRHSGGYEGQRASGLAGLAYDSATQTSTVR